MDADSDRKVWLPVLLLIVLAAVGMRILLAQVFTALDDAEYARVAHQISQGTFSIAGYTGPPVVPIRSGIVLPTAAFFRVFGPSEWTMAAYSFLMSMAILLLVFAFARKAFGAGAGLIAAGLWAFLPSDISMAAGLRPDVPSNAWAFIGVFAIYLARPAIESGRAKGTWHGTAAGLAFGAAWLCKESTVFFIPFCGLLMAFDLKRDWRRYLPMWAGVAAGSLLVLSAEMGFYAARVGDALYRLHAMERNYAMYPEFFFGEGSRFGFETGTSYWVGLAKRLFLDGPQAILLQPRFLYLPAFGLLATLYGFFWRDERFYFPGLLFVSLLLMFNFSSSSLSSYQPLPLFPRYFHILCPPAAVLAGGMLASALRRSTTRAPNENREAVFWGRLVATIMVVVTLYHGAFRPIRDRRPLWAAVEKSVVSMLQPSDAIYTDPLSRVGLEFYWGYPATMNVTEVNGVGGEATIPCGSFVLVNQRYLDWLELNRGMWLNLDGFEAPGTFVQPPAEWSEMWAGYDGRLFRVPCPTASL